MPSCRVSLQCPTTKYPCRAQPKSIPAVPKRRVSLECPTTKYQYSCSAFAVLQGRQLRGSREALHFLCNNGFRVGMLEVNDFAVWAGAAPPPKQQEIKHATAQTAKNETSKKHKQQKKTRQPNNELTGGGRMISSKSNSPFGALTKPDSIQISSFYTRLITQLCLSGCTPRGSVQILMSNLGLPVSNRWSNDRRCLRLSMT